jgi:hypothetical protein
MAFSYPLHSIEKRKKKKDALALFDVKAHDDEGARGVLALNLDALRGTDKFFHRNFELDLTKTGHCGDINFASP